MGVFCGCGLVGVKGGQTVHMVLNGVLVLWSLTFLSFTMIIIDLSMKALHPWSHRNYADISNLDGKAGKMCKFRATGGRDGRSRSHVCEDCTMDLSEVSIDNGVVVCCILM